MISSPLLQKASIVLRELSNRKEEDFLIDSDIYKKLEGKITSLDELHSVLNYLCSAGFVETEFRNIIGDFPISLIHYKISYKGLLLIEENNSKNDIDLNPNNQIPEDKNEKKQLNFKDNCANEIQINKTIQANNDKFKKENPYPQIFKDNGAFELFELLIKGTFTSHSDISFIYRVMVEDKLIFRTLHCVFIEFLAEKYGIKIKKIKTIYASEVKSEKKRKHYKTIKDQFNSLKLKGTTLDPK